MKIKYLGHSCFYFEMNDKKVIIDPFITHNDLAADIKVGHIQADFILLTHGHQDHVADAEQIAKNNDALLISNYEIVTWFEKKGVQGHPLNQGGQRTFDFGTIRYVNAIHSSSMPDGSYGGQPGGFVIWSDDNCFYHAGDTALTLDLKLIPAICPELNFAILPIGDNFTMGYQDAVIASNYIQCDTIIGCHYDTFGYIKIDHEAATNAFSSAGKKLILPTIGEFIEL